MTNDETNKNKKQKATSENKSSITSNILPVDEVGEINMSDFANMIKKKIQNEKYFIFSFKILSTANFSL